MKELNHPLIRNWKHSNFYGLIERHINAEDLLERRNDKSVK